MCFQYRVFDSRSASGPSFCLTAGNRLAARLACCGSRNRDVIALFYRRIVQVDVIFALDSPPSRNATGA